MGEGRTGVAEFLLSPFPAFLFGVRVLGAEFLDRPELNRAHRARGNARGLQALCETRRAGVALIHLLLRLREARHMPRARALAGTAADALRMILDHETVRVLVVRLHGADRGAGRIVAVVAPLRDVIEVVDVFVALTEPDTVRHPLLFLTRHHAGAAPGAAGPIKDKT